MAVCLGKLTDDLLNNCDVIAKKGLLGSKAVAINYDDIDRAASTKVKALISAIVLGSGLSGFDIEWFGNLASANSNGVIAADASAGHAHGFLCRVSNVGLDGIERAAELLNGRFIIVVPTKFEGATGEDRYKVFGWEHGLKMSEIIYNTVENDASALYTLTTEEGDKEPYLANIFLEGTPAVSKASFDTKFLTV